MNHLRKGFAVVSVLLLQLAVVAPSIAQDPCSNLLTHGIYDYYREQGQSSSLSEIRHEVCSAYQKYSQAKTAGEVDVSYKVFAAGASFSAEQIEAIGQQMCDLNYSYATAASLQARASAVISPAAVQAWQSCVTQHNGGLRVTTDIASDGGVLDLSVYYVPLPGTTYPTVTDVIISPVDGLKCKGDLLKAATSDATLSSQAMQLTCERAVANAPVTLAGREYWALPVSLAIHTTAGNIVRRLSGIPVPPDPASPNIGDVLASVLPEAPFATLHGPGWVLADGRAVPGSKYAASIAAKVPDLRGVFLRGINAGRTDGYADPQGDRSPGTLQDYATAVPKAGFGTNKSGAHNHEGKFVGNGSGVHASGPYPNPAYGAQPIVTDGEHAHVINGGDVETRPRNAAVFYYIRVD